MMVCWSPTLDAVLLVFNMGCWFAGLQHGMLVWWFAGLQHRMMVAGLVVLSIGSRCAGGSFSSGMISAKPQQNSCM